MSTAETIYMASPVWLQNGFAAAYGYWWHRRRFGRHFDRLVEEFRQHEGWTRSRFLELQTRSLAQVLRAATTSPYYAPLFVDARITADTPPWEALRRLPVLSKEQLR